MVNINSPEAGERFQSNPLYQKAWKAQTKSGLTRDKENISGMNHGSRVSKSFPNQAEAWLKMQDLGQAGVGYYGDVDNPMQNTVDFGDKYPVSNDEILKKLYELNFEVNGKAEGLTEPKPIGLIDALYLMYDIGDNGNKLEINNQVIENFLDSLSITTILSNFVSVNAPDYVYGRLLNLSKEELDVIKKEYGKDFSAWGKKCDGCGISTWKTNIIPDAHDDAHINLEYMAGERGYQGSSVNEAKSKKTGGSSTGRRKLVEMKIPFQIHHMNENPNDNTPLNLSCLCPNCHALTGSYGKQKSAIDQNQHPDFLKKYLDNEGSLIRFLNPEETKRLKDAMLQSDFENRSLANQMVGTNDDIRDGDMDGNIINPSAFLLRPEEIKDSAIANVGIDPAMKEELVNDFNRLFFAIYKDAQEKFEDTFNGKLNEETETGEHENGDEEGDYADSETQPLTMLGLPLTFSLKTSTNGTISLHIYAGNEPDYVDAFDNPAIPFNEMFWSPSEEVRVRTTKRIENNMFFSILNAIKSLKNSIKRLKLPDGYQGTGKKAYNMSRISRDVKSGVMQKMMSGEPVGKGVPDERTMGIVFSVAAGEIPSNWVENNILTTKNGSYSWNPSFTMQVVKFLRSPEGERFIGDYNGFKAFLENNGWVSPAF